jgi:iron complex outermembrane receptor protein
VATSSPPAATSASRSVQALYVEASIPFAPAFESQLAARYDHYGDFGSTVNPKVALRWQPMKTLLLRASWGTGFRAPTLYDLFTPAQHGIGSPDLGDPLRCPVTGRAEDCGDLPFVIGGNPALQPETSKQFSAGAVWEPVSGFAMTLDYWRIDKRSVFGALGADVVLGDLPRWGATNLVRGPADPNFPNLPGPIDTVVLLNQNLGNLRTSGYDVDWRWRLPQTRVGRFTLGLNGTYIRTLEQQANGTDYQSLVGNNDLGPVPRWRHYASIGWSRELWTATLSQTFQSGYREVDQRTCGDDGVCTGTRRVGTYSTWDLQADYSGLKNTRIVVGIRNLFDRNPPFTQQSQGFAGGDDAQYADPRGRTFYAKLAFTFR